MSLSLILFAVTAVGGLVLAVMRIKEVPLPLPLALVHGALGACGLTSLALVLIGEGGASDLAKLAMGLFVVAAAGGFVLFASHLRKKQIGLGLMFLHAVVAIAGFGALLGAFLS